MGEEQVASNDILPSTFCCSLKVCNYTEKGNGIFFMTEIQIDKNFEDLPSFGGFLCDL